MKIENFIVGMYETNSYIVYDEDTLEACVIDSGDQSKSLIRFVDRNNLMLKAIILTHYHYDHIGAVMELKNKFNSHIYCHKRERLGLMDPEINGSKIGNGKIISITPDTVLSEGDIIRIGNIALEIIHTPGHTPGSICIKAKGKNIVFTGDTIFSDDLGRTDLIGGSEEMLKKSIVNKVSKWSDEIVIYPGHGESCIMKEVRSRRIPYITPKGR